MISIVMPAYNAEKYIGEALDSVLAQTYGDWECIIVDDCSTDDTAEIIKKYAEQDTRIKFHRLDTNSGSAKEPRDQAIIIAQAEWIVTLDADDTLEPEYLTRLVERQKQTGADIVLSRMTFVDGNNNFSDNILPKREFDMAQILTGEKAVMLTIGSWMIGAIGMISRTIVDTRTQKAKHMNADEYDTRQMLLNAKKIAFVEAEYYYRNNPVSITKNASPRLFETLITDYALTELFARHFGRGSAEHKRVEAAFYDGIIAAQLKYGSKKHELDKEGYLYARELIRKHKKKIVYRHMLLNKNLDWKKRAVLILPKGIFFMLAGIIYRGR